VNKALSLWLMRRDSWEFSGNSVRFTVIHGLALAILGVVLLGLQAFSFMAPAKVISGITEAARPKVEQRTDPAAGIVGVISLIAGVGIFVTRKADEPEAKNAVSWKLTSLSRPAIVLCLT
jgi:hypothetical protein